MNFFLKGRLLLASAVLFVPLIAFASEPAGGLKSDCAKVEARVPWSYCVTESVGSNNLDVLYFLHDAHDNEKTWENDKVTRAIRDEWARRGFRAPRVVTVSFGDIWLLAEKNTSKDSGLFEMFTREIMPAIESRISPSVGRRYLLGISMGGFNALQLALKKGELFEKAVILCPAIAGVSPHSTSDEISAYIKRNKASGLRVKAMFKIARHFYPDESSYRAADPLAVIQSAPLSTIPPLQISCGSADEFGFYEGASRFASLAQRAGVKVEWRSLQGGHCAADAGSAAAFLTQRNN
jgi:predicted esterase